MYLTILYYHICASTLTGISRIFPPKCPIHIDCYSLYLSLTTYLPPSPQILGDRDHFLIVLVRECLNNLPACRPNIASILKGLEELSREAEDDEMDKNKLQLMMELQRMSEELQKLESSFDELQVCSTINQRVSRLSM